MFLTKNFSSLIKSSNKYIKMPETLIPFVQFPLSKSSGSRSFGGLDKGFYGINIQNILEFFEWYKDTQLKLTFVFERFEISNAADLSLFIEKSYKINIKLSEWKVCLIEDFYVSWDTVRKSTIMFSKWDILDNEENRSLLILFRLMKCLTRSSYRLNDVIFELTGVLEAIKCPDVLVFGRK